MEYRDLVNCLVDSVANYSKWGFDRFLKLHNSNENISEELVCGEQSRCNLQCWVMQHYVSGNEDWIDVFVIVNDEDMKIGSNITLHRDGMVEISGDIFLHTFNGLPKRIGSMEVKGKSGG